MNMQSEGQSFWGVVEHPGSSGHVQHPSIGGTGSNPPSATVVNRGPAIRIDNMKKKTLGSIIRLYRLNDLYSIVATIHFSVKIDMYDIELLAML